MNTKYDRIGKGYNETRKADPILLQNIIRLLAPEKNKLYLDIGCGTGNYTIELHKLGYLFIGVDPSDEMLKVSRLKEPAIQWLKGTAENIPLEDNSVDGLLATLTIHHWQNLEKAFAELNRVAKPQADLLIFTSSPRQMQAYWLNHYFPNMMEASTHQMPQESRVIQAMEKAGFKLSKAEDFFIHKGIEDQFLSCGKEEPELYLNPQIRSGISSFADLSNKDEVEAGLKKLEADIESGKIEQVRKSFDQSQGDYLYLIAEKA